MAKTKEKIQQAYLSYVEDNNQRPPSVLLFAKSIKLKEADFYKEYGSWETLEADLFLGFMTDSIEALQGSKEFELFSSRERMISFFYTWVGKMQEHRSFIRFVHEQDPLPCIGQNYLKNAKSSFISFSRKVIKEGIEKDEIADRWLVTRSYRNILWGQANAVFNFWLGDGSANFERTDAYIEKSGNFFFDLVQPNALDSGFDFAKFLFRG